MISVRQWIISALGLLTIVTFCTYQLLDVHIPRNMERAEWVRFVSTQIPGGESLGASTSLWSLFMGIQAVQLVFGIPFLHVTQISMGFLLHPALGFMSCAALECLVMYGFLLIQAHTVDMLAEEAQRALPMVGERRAKRLWFAFSMLMSSLPVYMSVVTVHVGIVRRHEFALLAVLVSVLSVSKNVVLSALLRSRQMRFCENCWTSGFRNAIYHLTRLVGVVALLIHSLLQWCQVVRLVLILAFLLRNLRLLLSYVATLLVKC